MATFTSRPKPAGLRARRWMTPGWRYHRDHSLLTPARRVYCCGANWCIMCRFVSCCDCVVWEAVEPWVRSALEGSWRRQTHTARCWQANIFITSRLVADRRCGRERSPKLGHDRRTNELWHILVELNVHSQVASTNLHHLAIVALKFGSVTTEKANHSHVRALVTYDEFSAPASA